MYTEPRGSVTGTTVLDGGGCISGPSLAVPRCEYGLGSVVVRATDAGLIDGVQTALVSVWPDDRGYFVEVCRAGRGLASGFAPETMQVSATVSYPGTIKAFHYHRLQYDCWLVTSGMLQVALADLRVDSPTFGLKNTLYIGCYRPWQVLIPPGVAHGYKVIGARAASLVYVTSRFYDPADEGRLPWNDSGLNYDWNRQRK